MGYIYIFVKNAFGLHSKLVIGYEYILYFTTRGIIILLNTLIKYLNDDMTNC